MVRFCGLKHNPEHPSGVEISNKSGESRGEQNQSFLKEMNGKVSVFE